MSLLTQTLRDKVLQDYNVYAGISCFVSGDTLHCDGPWLYGDQWANATLPSAIFNSTPSDPYQCSSDLTYLQPDSETRVLNGFSADNITESLITIANSVSLYATYICSQNATCASVYSNDTEQMFVDHSNYINSTFFAYMTKTLPQDGSQLYCPAPITGYSSLFQYMFSYYDGSKEYFGIHNAIFMPGVAENINGTVNEVRVEFASIIGNNGLRGEGAFLNMVFFNYVSPPETKRSSNVDEIYPGCPRREFVLKGECAGVIPPREFDRAGRVLSMKERDYRKYLTP